MCTIVKLEILHLLYITISSGMFELNHAAHKRMNYETERNNVARQWTYHKFSHDRVHARFLFHS